MTILLALYCIVMYLIHININKEVYMITKQCTECKKELPATDEYFHRSKNFKSGIRAKCKECCNKKSREYHYANREQCNRTSKEWYHSNRERAKSTWRVYADNNQDRIKERGKIWLKENRQKINMQFRERRRKNRKFALNQNIGAHIAHALKGEKRGRKWQILVGYSLEDLVNHIESKFKEGMTWDNYGEWHLDHIIPSSAFNFTKPEHEDFKRCWELNNLQPLWKDENQQKSDKIEKPFQPLLAL